MVLARAPVVSIAWDPTGTLQSSLTFACGNGVIANLVISPNPDLATAISRTPFKQHTFAPPVTKSNTYVSTARGRVSLPVPGMIMWDVDAATVIRTIGPPELLGATTLSKDSKFLAVARRYIYQIYDVESGMVTRTFKHKLGSSVADLRVAFAHADTAFLGVYDDGALRLWDLVRQTKMQTLQTAQGLLVTLTTISNEEIWRAVSAATTQSVRMET
ncbi:hypothetical protein LXA43DRAFT_1062768 [Ganoderma leucocontextum]|nr:hypothetical protein LXA43DRAFT_1062768 [Ganoderma leucocontextum]